MFPGRFRVLLSHSIQLWTFNSKAVTKGPWLKTPLSGVRLWFKHCWAGNATDNQLFTHISGCHQFCPLPIFWRHRSCINSMRLFSRGFYQLHMMRERSVNLDHLYYQPCFVSNDAAVYYNKSVHPLTPHKGVIASILSPSALVFKENSQEVNFHQRFIQLTPTQSFSTIF